MLNQHHRLSFKLSGSLKLISFIFPVSSIAVPGRTHRPPPSCSSVLPCSGIGRLSSRMHLCYLPLISTTIAYFPLNVVVLKMNDVQLVKKYIRKVAHFI